MLIVPRPADAGCIPTKARLVPIHLVLKIRGALFFKSQNAPQKQPIFVSTSHNDCTKLGLKISIKSQLVFYQQLISIQFAEKKCCKIVQIAIFSSSIAPRGARASNFALSAQAQKRTNN
jgi:hypothetical protein